MILGCEMDARQLATLRNLVFPEAVRARTGLSHALRRQNMTGLFIADRGAKGLGGPVVADQVSPDGTYDWVDFMLNVGKPNEEDHTGGTYGFGKTIAYVVSAVSAVVVHSKTKVSGSPQSRLMACAIGPEFSLSGKLHTGRHWWAKLGSDVPVPVSGRAADALASKIGMPPFEEDDYGTNILVVDPDLGGRTPEQMMRFIAESVTWHLWPKMMDRGQGPPMEISVAWNGHPIAVPAPRDRPPLHGFVQAFQALLDDIPQGRRADGVERTVIRCLRPQADVGDLVTIPLVARARVEVDDGHEPSEPEGPPSPAAISGVCHHVALMRTPELVVTYMPGPTPSDTGTEWAGVFRSRAEMDAHFAAAEPPSHDSWRPELIPKGRAKTLVKVGLSRIREVL
jgi:hypothetical protein